MSKKNTQPQNRKNSFVDSRVIRTVQQLRSASLRQNLNTAQSVRNRNQFNQTTSSGLPRPSSGIRPAMSLKQQNPKLLVLQGYQSSKIIKNFPSRPSSSNSNAVTSVGSGHIQRNKHILQPIQNTFRTSEQKGDYMQSRYECNSRFQFVEQNQQQQQQQQQNVSAIKNMEQALISSYSDKIYEIFLNSQSIKNAITKKAHQFDAENVYKIITSNNHFNNCLGKQLKKRPSKAKLQKFILQQVERWVEQIRIEVEIQKNEQNLENSFSARLEKLTQLRDRLFYRK